MIGVTVIPQTISVDGTTLETVSGVTRVKDAGIDAAKLANNAVTNDKILNSTIADAKLAAPRKGINATASVSDVAAFSTSSDTYVDATGYTVDIVTTRQCTILAWFFCQGSTDSGGYSGAVRLMIDGTAQLGSGVWSATANHEFNISVAGRKTGVAAGTITVKVQARRTNGAATFALEQSAGVLGNGLYVMAVEEV